MIQPLQPPKSAMSKQSTKDYVLVINANSNDGQLLEQSNKGIKRLLYTKTKELFDEEIPCQQLAGIIYNITHPYQNSVNMIKRIKQECPLSVPIITAIWENSLEIEREIRKLGIFYYMIKPFDEWEINEVLSCLPC